MVQRDARAGTAMSRLAYVVMLGTALLLAGCTDQTDPMRPSRELVLRLAVTTSTRDSGLLDTLVPIFEEKYAARVDVIAVGTGAALKLGEAGDVDVVLVHAREAEDAFMAAGHGVRREDVMYNTFEIVGPADDPAGVRGMEPGPALKEIAAKGQPFVSRGDNSGTHQREQKLWAEAKGRPEWDQYIESGQGMGITLTMADQLNAYVLTDRGTYLRLKGKTRLVTLVSSSDRLRNPYGIIVVNAEKHRHIHSQLAQAFTDFMIAPATQQLIRDYKIDGEQLFHPLRLREEG